MDSTFNLRGVFILEHRDKTGSLKGRYTIDNTITSVGKYQTIRRIGAFNTLPFKYMAIGSSSTAAAVGNTALAAEITSPSLKRVASTMSTMTTNVMGDTLVNTHTFSSTATQAVQEVGLFDTATSGGNMPARTTFAAKNMVTGDTLAITHKIIVS